MKVAAYIRVSTDEQANEGFSIEAQKRNIIEWTIKHNYEIYDFYIDDGYSGKNLNRPKIKKLLLDIKDNKFDIVLVYCLDRLTRDIVDLWTLIDNFKHYKIEFLSVTDQTTTSTAGDRLNLNIKGIFAQYERERIGERVAVAMEQRAKEGWYTGRVPLGYNYDSNTKMYSINEDEAKIVKRIFQMHIDGYGSNKICKKLNLEGLRNKRGNEFAENSINYMLTHAWYYSGYFLYHPKNKEPIYLKANNIEPIFTIEEFKKIKKYTNERKKFPKKIGNNNYIFKNKLYCSSCHKRLTTLSTFNKKRNNYILYYKCHRTVQGRCNNKGINQTLMENFFINYLNKYFNNIYEVKIKINLKQIDEIDKEIIKLKENIEKINNRKKKLHYMILDDFISKADYKEILINLENDLKEINIKIKERENKKSELVNLNKLTEFKIITKSIIDIWCSLLPLEKKEFINKFIKYIEVDKENGIKQIEFYQ